MQKFSFASHETYSSLFDLINIIKSSKLTKFYNFPDMQTFCYMISALETPTTSELKQNDARGDVALMRLLSFQCDKFNNSHWEIP